MLVGKEQRRVWQVDEGPFVTEKRAASDLSFGRRACLEQVFELSHHRPDWMFWMRLDQGIKEPEAEQFMHSAVTYTCPEWAVRVKGWMA